MYIWYFHENSDTFFVGKPKQDFGKESMFIHEVCDAKTGQKTDLIGNSFEKDLNKATVTEKSIIHFDLETTGTSLTKDRIVQISVIKTDLSFNIIDEKRNYYINPEMQIPKEASDVHGITNDMVLNKPTFKQYASGLHKYFTGNIWAGYNIKRFDVPLLIEELLRCNLTFNPNEIEIFDSYLVFSKKEPRTLSGAYKYFCNKELDNAHNAEADNMATLDVADSQLFKYDISVLDAVEICNEPIVDFAGKLSRNEKGEIIYTFGEHKGKTVKSNTGFAQWMLTKDFTKDTKNKINQILNNKLI